MGRIEIGRTGWRRNVIRTTSHKWTCARLLDRHSWTTTETLAMASNLAFTSTTRRQRLITIKTNCKQVLQWVLVVLSCPCLCVCSSLQCLAGWAMHILTLTHLPADFWSSIVRVPGGGGRVVLGTRLHLYTCSFYRSQPCHNPIPSYNITYYLYIALFSVVAWFTFQNFISQYEQLAHSESQQLVNLQPRVDTQKWYFCLKPQVNMCKCQKVCGKIFCRLKKTYFSEYLPLHG